VLGAGGDVQRAQLDVTGRHLGVGDRADPELTQHAVVRRDQIDQPGFRPGRRLPFGAQVLSHFQRFFFELEHRRQSVRRRAGRDPLNQPRLFERRGGDSHLPRLGRRGAERNGLFATQQRAEQHHLFRAAASV
jgi:hypothetical protein